MARVAGPSRTLALVLADGQMGRPDSWKQITQRLLASGLDLSLVTLDLGGCGYQLKRAQDYAAKFGVLTLQHLCSHPYPESVFPAGHATTIAALVELASLGATTRRWAGLLSTPPGAPTWWRPGRAALAGNLPSLPRLVLAGIVERERSAATRIQEERAAFEARRGPVPSALAELATAISKVSLGGMSRYPQHPPTLVGIRWDSASFRVQGVIATVTIAPNVLPPTTWRCDFAATVLDALKDPAWRGRETLLEELGKPAWQRALAALSEGRISIDRATFDIDCTHGVVVTTRFERVQDGRVTPVGGFPELGAEDGAIVELLESAGPTLHDVERELLHALDRRHRKVHADEFEAVARNFGAPLAALELLARHPRARFHCGDVDLVATRVDVELSAYESAGGVGIRAYQGGVPVPPPVPRDVATSVDATRFLFGAVPPQAAMLLDLFDGEGALVPVEHAGDLFDALERVGAPVQLPEALTGRELTPRPEITSVALDVVPGGVSLRAMVTPIAAGRAIEAGDGSATLRGLDGGELAFTRRDLTAEVEAARRTFEQLGIDRSAVTKGSATVSGDRVWPLLIALADPAQTIPVEGIKPTQAHRKDLTVEVQAKRDWFAVSGGVEIDGEIVALSELVAANATGARYVRLGKKKLIVLADGLRQRLDELVDALGGDLDAALTPAALLALTQGEDETIVFDAAAAALRDRLRAAEEFEPSLPAGFGAELRPYQLAGFVWLARLASWCGGALLADDMGLGKTVQTLALLTLRATGPQIVVCPMSVLSVWESEANRFAPALDVRVFHGFVREAALDGLGPGALVITSYDILVRDVERLSAIGWSTAVFDEAQAIKNAEARRSEAAAALKADAKVALTGTPVENHLGDLWAIFRAVSPGLLGTWKRFRERFVQPIERGDAERRRALARLLRPFMLRRTKEAVAPELPRKTEIDRRITLPREHRKVYEAVRLAALAQDLGGEPNQARIKVLAMIMKLRLAACHPALAVPGTHATSAKLDSLFELLGELRELGRRTLVFSQFTSLLRLAHDGAEERGSSVLYLDGGTPAFTRKAAVAAFQDGEADVFFISLKAGGSGLTLTTADTVIHLDPWWNPAAEDQATDRAHRIGQDKPVTVIRLVSTGTIEEAVLSLHGEKRDLARSVLDGADVSGKLETRELLELVRAGSAPAPLEEAPTAATGDANDSPRHDQGDYDAAVRRINERGYAPGTAHNYVRYWQRWSAWSEAARRAGAAATVEGFLADPRGAGLVMNKKSIVQALRAGGLDV